MTCGPPVRWTLDAILAAVAQFVARTGHFPGEREFRNAQGLPAYCTVLERCQSLTRLHTAYVARYGRTAAVPRSAPAPPAVPGPPPQGREVSCLGVGCTRRFWSDDPRRFRLCEDCRDRPPAPDGRWMSGRDVPDDAWDLLDWEDDGV